MAVHGRTKDERPNHPNHLDVLQKVSQHCKIPMIANGGSANTRDSPINTYEGRVCNPWTEKIQRPHGVQGVPCHGKPYFFICIVNEI